MSSKYVVPHCVRPIFLQSSKDSSKQCGLINGLIYCTMLTITIGAMGGRFYYKETDPVIKKYILYGIIGSLTCIWLFIPIIVRYGYGTIWEGYDQTTKDLMAQGYTKEQALSIIQGIAGDAEPQLGFAQSVSAAVFTQSNGKDKEKKAVTQPSQQSSHESSQGSKMTKYPMYSSVGEYAYSGLSDFKDMKNSNKTVNKKYENERYEQNYLPPYG